MRVADVRSYFTDRLKSKKFVTDKTGVKTIEMVGASFLADEPAIFGTPNEEYIKEELQWYMSTSRNVNDMKNPPKIWRDVASPSGEINSNYGWCIWTKDNYDQWNHVLDELSKNPNSRRAIMIYTRPSMWEDYNRDGMSDFMCTNAVQYVVRDGLLHSIVQMRSNDVVFGYRNDYAWQRFVQKGLAKQLKLGTGDIHWQVGSLHVYERHFDMVV